MQKKYSEDRVNILIACDANDSRPWFRDRIPSIEKSASELEWNIEVVDSVSYTHLTLPTIYSV